MLHRVVSISLLALSFLAFTPAANAERPTFEIVIKEHKFIPEVLEIPAGEKVKLLLDNQDPTPEEFESHDFHREKIIAGNSKAIVFVGPLDPGEYSYFGEFNPETAQGKIIAK